MKCQSNNTVKARVKLGQIIVENKINGVLFSFPAAVWPEQPASQRNWIERLTPWWDMNAPDWTPMAHRLRESCVSSINKLLIGIEPAKSASESERKAKA